MEISEGSVVLAWKLAYSRLADAAEQMEEAAWRQDEQEITAASHELAKATAFFEGVISVLGEPPGSKKPKPEESTLI